MGPGRSIDVNERRPKAGLSSLAHWPQDRANLNLLKITEALRLEYDAVTAIWVRVSAQERDIGQERSLLQPSPLLHSFTAALTLAGSAAYCNLRGTGDSTCAL